MKDLSFRDILPLKKASKQGQDVDSGDSHASSLATKSIPHNDAVPELRNVFTFGTRQSNYRDAASSVTSGNPFAAILDEKNSSGGRDSGAKSAVGTLSPSKQDAAMTSINHTAATSSQTAPPHFRVDQASVLNSGLTPNPKLFIDLQAQRVEESGPDVHASHARASGPFRATPIKIDFGKISQVFGQPTQDSEQESPGDPLADLVATTNALKLDDGEPQQDKSQPQEPVIQGQDPAVIQIDIGKREKYLNACRESDTSTLKQLFAEERQETIGYVDEEGNNGILLATQSSSDIETMHYLHEQGVSITHTNHISRTPLMEATRWGSLEQVRYLEEHLQSIDFEVEDINSHRAVYFANNPSTHLPASEGDERKRRHGQISSPPTILDREEIQVILMSNSRCIWKPRTHPVQPPLRKQVPIPPLASVSAVENLGVVLPSKSTPATFSVPQPARMPSQSSFYAKPAEFPTKLLPYDILYTYPTGEVEHYVLQKTLIPPPSAKNKAFAALSRGPAFETVYAMSGGSQPDHAHVINNVVWSHKGRELINNLGVGPSSIIYPETHVEPQLLAFLVQEHTIEMPNGERSFPPSYNLEPRITINKPDFCIACSELVDRFEKAWPEARVTYRFMDGRFR